MPRPRFPDTRWSLVGRAANPDEPTRRQALAELLAAYRPGLQAFLVETRRLPADLAEDLLHDFIADKVLSLKLVHHADQGRGRFRSFLVRSLNNFVTSRLNREYAIRAKTAGLEEAETTASPPDAGTDCFEREWVKQVVRDALERMEADCRADNRADLWEIFRMRVVEPMIHDTEPVDYEHIVTRFGIQSPRQAMNLLASAKRRFVPHLRAAVGRYVANAEAIDDEIADLRKIVGR
jgi:RNA polymerase sigma-70 factor (ECF subfamily)